MVVAMQAKMMIWVIESHASEHKVIAMKSEKNVLPHVAHYPFEYIGRRSEERSPFSEARGTLCRETSHWIKQWHWFCVKMHPNFLSTSVLCAAYR